MPKSTELHQMQARALRMQADALMARGAEAHLAFRIARPSATLPRSNSRLAMLTLASYMVGLMRRASLYLPAARSNCSKACRAMPPQAHQMLKQAASCQLLSCKALASMHCPLHLQLRGTAEYHLVWARHVRSALKL